MKEEEIIKEAEEIEDHIKTYGHDIKKERGPLWYILAVLLALMVVAMVVPYYGIKLDPEPKYIATIDEVLPAEFEVENISRSINKKQDFLIFAIALVFCHIPAPVPIAIALLYCN